MRIITKKETGLIYNHIEKSDTEIVTAHLTVDCYWTLSLFEYASTVLYTDMLLSGAGKYSRNEFLDEINRLGASIGVDASDGRISITIETLGKKLPKVLALAKSMLLSPRFDQKELDRAKKTTYNELEIEKEQARLMAEQAFSRVIYPSGNRNHQYAPADVQTALKKVSRKDLIDLHQRVLSRTMILTVGANAKNAAMVKKMISGVALPLNDLKITKSSIPKASVPKKALVTTSIPSYQNIEFSIGGLLPLDLKHPDLPAFYFGLAVLGKWGGFAGRLMSTVREKEGLTYGIYARMEKTTVSETGHWRIMTFFAPKDCQRALASTRREIEAIATAGITDTELKRFKNILHTGHILSFDSLVQLTRLIHSQQVSGFSYSDMEEFHRQLQQLNRDQVNKALKTYLRPNLLTISAAGPVTKIMPILKATIK